jgi:beta-phosphoglucomutase-like phosphatase (HAD superfamily)/dTDP-glucose pyrophosphorylase
MIKAIIFDLDGVLVETKDIHFEALNLAIKKICKINNPISYKDHLNLYDGLPTKEKLKIFFKKKLSKDKINKISLEKQKVTSNLIKKKIVYNDRIFRIFKSLYNKGYDLCVASNAIKSTVNTCLNILKIKKFIKYSLSNNDIKNPKPHPEIYLKLFIQLGLSPKDTVIIEDSYYGLKAARESGANVFQLNNSEELRYKDLTDYIKILNGNKKSTNMIWKNKKMNVLIPMAGEGSRFTKAGYTFPKPLIEIYQKPMIQIVVENLGLDANFIFLVRKEHDQKYNVSSLLKVISPNCKIVLVDKLTEGAACTTLLAEKYINKNDPLMIANSDQFIEWNSSKVLYELTNKHLDGGIIVFKSVHPKWSYAKTDDNDIVTQVAEKVVISDNATVGIYFWKKGSDYVKYAKKMIKENIRVNNEFYVCPVFNEAIKDKKIIKIKKIKKMWGLGTPEDLDYFYKNFKGNI